MKTQHIPVIAGWIAAVVVVLALLPWLAAARDKATLDQQLIQAAKRGDVALVQRLLARGVDVNAR